LSTQFRVPFVSLSNDWRVVGGPGGRVFEMLPMAWVAFEVNGPEDIVGHLEESEEGRARWLFDDESEAKRELLRISKELEGLVRGREVGPYR